MAHPFEGNDDTTALWLFNAAAEPIPEEIGGHADAQLDNINDGDPPIYQADGWGIASTQAADDYAVDNNAAGGIQTPNANDYALWFPSANNIIVWDMVIRFEAVTVGQFFSHYNSNFGIVPQLVSNTCYMQIGCSDGNNFRWVNEVLSGYVNDHLYMALAFDRTDCSTLVAYYGNLTESDANTTQFTNASSGTGTTFRPRTVGNLTMLLNNEDCWMSAARVRNPVALPNQAAFDVEYQKVLNWDVPAGGKKTRSRGRGGFKGGGFGHGGYAHKTDKLIDEPTTRECYEINTWRC